MSGLTKDFADALFGSSQICGIAGGSDNDADIAPVGDFLLQGSNRNENLVVLVGTGRSPTLGSHDANDLQASTLNANGLANRVRGGKKFLADGVAEDADGSSFLDVGIGIKPAGGETPAANIFDFWSAAGRGGVAGSGRCGYGYEFKLRLGDTDKHGPQPRVVAQGLNVLR
ncbi:hypothetical protein HRbin36_02341 [bacterium HR36]|nr:hypothetical protein HRbin36_02341 [bacterium HR36]